MARYSKKCVIYLNVGQQQDARAGMKRLKLGHRTELLRLALAAGLAGDSPVRKSPRRGGKPKPRPVRLWITAEMYEQIREVARSSRLRLVDLYAHWFADLRNVPAPANQPGETSQLGEDLSQVGQASSETISAPAETVDTLPLPGQGEGWRQAS